MPDIKITHTECIKCGTCCKKGGPSFHYKDRQLIEKGIILSRYLYTIREGELSYDNIINCLHPAPTDIIKIKGQKGSWTCVFFDDKNNQCTIYDNRPLECRILKCWDTREIEKVYSKTRLTRKNLLSSVEGLWELIEDHQKRCSYKMLSRYLNELKNGTKDIPLEKIQDMLRYDEKIRNLIVEKGSLEFEMTDFLFGRPITETIRIYGFKIKKDHDMIKIIPVHHKS